MTRRARVILVRHADHSAERSAGGDPDLTELGIWQAQRLADRFTRTGEARNCSRLCTSDLLRAKHTAEIVRDSVGTGLLPLEVNDDLAELAWSTSDLRLLDTAATKDSRPLQGAETWNEFEARVRSALRNYATEPGTTMLVCHTGVIELSFVEFAGLDRRSQRFAMAPRNASITAWVRLDTTADARWRLETYNDFQHLWVEGNLRHREQDFSPDEPFWDILEPE